jgi:hypothetical protein
MEQMTPGLYFSVNQRSSTELVRGGRRQASISAAYNDTARLGRSRQLGSEVSMTRSAALQTAIELAIAELEGVDLNSRCPGLGLPAPTEDGIELRLFGMVARLDPGDWSLRIEASGEPARPADRLLLLHYLGCDLPIIQSGELVSFRNLTGGQFYFPAFEARTVKPLVERFGNDIDQLRSQLARFDHELGDLGDLSARIHAMGNLWVTLVYHLGDDEFPADADLLFDSCISHVFGAEDAAVMGSRVCIALL